MSKGRKVSSKDGSRGGSYVIRSAVGGRAVVAGSKTGRSAVVRQAIKSGQIKDGQFKNRKS